MACHWGFTLKGTDFVPLGYIFVPYRAQTFISFISRLFQGYLNIVIS